MTSVRVKDMGSAFAVVDRAGVLRGFAYIHTFGVSSRNLRGDRKFSKMVVMDSVPHTKAGAALRAFKAAWGS